MSRGMGSVAPALFLGIINFISLVICILFLAVGIWIIASPDSLSAFIQQHGGAEVKLLEMFVFLRPSENPLFIISEAPRSVLQQGSYSNCRTNNRFNNNNRSKSNFVGCLVSRNRGLLQRDVLSVQIGVGIFMVAGFLFTVSFMGFYGAINKSQFLLFMYAVIIFLLLLLECALLFYFSTGLVEKGLQEHDGQWSHAVRIILQCCEYNSSTTNVIPPWSCCGATSYPDRCLPENLYRKNCQQATSDFITKYQTAIYSSLAALHMGLVSCALIRRSCVARAKAYS